MRDLGYLGGDIEGNRMTWSEMRSEFHQMTPAQYEAVTEVMAVACMGNPFDEQWEAIEGGGMEFAFGMRYQMVLDKIAELVKPPATVLDVGCWQGHLILELAQQGYCVAGMDLSPFAVKRTRERFGLLTEEAQINLMWLRQGWAHELLPEVGQFDVIICQETLEHIPDRCLPATCEGLVQAAGQLLIVQVPGWDDGWPLHLRVFTPEQLRAAIERPYMPLNIEPGPCLMAWGVRTQCP